MSIILYTVAHQSDTLVVTTKYIVHCVGVNRADIWSNYCGLFSARRVRQKTPDRARSVSRLLDITTQTAQSWVYVSPDYTDQIYAVQHCGLYYNRGTELPGNSSVLYLFYRGVIQFRESLAGKFKEKSFRDKQRAESQRERGRERRYLRVGRRNESKIFCFRI